MATQQEEDLSSQLEWVKLREELSTYDNESQVEKIKRKTKENPLIPIGALVTSGAIVYGLRCMIIGDSKRQQHMMRLRVGAQSFTILVIAFSLTAAAKARGSRKNYE